MISAQKYRDYCHKMLVFLVDNAHCGYDDEMFEKCNKIGNKLRDGEYNFRKHYPQEFAEYAQRFKSSRELVGVVSPYESKKSNKTQITESFEFGTQSLIATCGDYMEEYGYKEEGKKLLNYAETDKYNQQEIIDIIGTIGTVYSDAKSKEAERRDWDDYDDFLSLLNDAYQELNFKFGDFGTNESKRKANKTKITESQLKAIVAESVKRILVKEGFMDKIKSGIHNVGQKLLDSPTDFECPEGFKELVKEYGWSIESKLNKDGSIRIIPSGWGSSLNDMANALKKQFPDAQVYNQNEDGSYDDYCLHVLFNEGGQSTGSLGENAENEMLPPEDTYMFYHQTNPSMFPDKDFYSYKQRYTQQQPMDMPQTQEPKKQPFQEGKKSFDKIVAEAVRKSINEVDVPQEAFDNADFGVRQGIVSLEAEILGYLHRANKAKVINREWVSNMYNLRKQLEEVLRPNDIENVKALVSRQEEFIKKHQEYYSRQFGQEISVPSRSTFRAMENLSAELSKDPNLKDSRLNGSLEWFIEQYKFDTMPRDMY